MRDSRCRVWRRTESRHLSGAVELDSEDDRSENLDVMSSLRRNHDVLAGSDDPYVIGLILEDEADGSASHHEPPPDVGGGFVS